MVSLEVQPYFAARVRPPIAEAGRLPASLEVVDAFRCFDEMAVIWSSSLLGEAVAPTTSFNVPVGKVSELLNMVFIESTLLPALGLGLALALPSAVGLWLWLEMLLVGAPGAVEKSLPVSIAAPSASAVEGALPKSVSHSSATRWSFVCCSSSSSSSRSMPWKLTFTISKYDYTN